jgi:hypothetical protein
VPAIKILDRIHLLLARTRLAAARLRDRIAPAHGFVAHFTRTFDLRSARALFRTSQAVFVLHDRAAGLRDRLPGKPDMAGSTVIAYGAVGIMSAILVNDLLGPTPANSSVAPTPEKRPEWVEIVRPHATSFALESPMLAGLDASYDVSRHRIGGGRRDTLTFGHAESGRAYMRLSLYRPGREGMAEPDPIEAVAALAAVSGIDAELQETSGKLRTKFGDLPAINMRVQGQDGWRNCLAVAGGWSDPRLGLVAWWCNPGPEMVALGEFACLLDRLALMSSGNEEQLAEFFARAELRRSFCNPQSSFVSPTPHRPDDWIHAKRKPQLRGRLSTR